MIERRFIDAKEMRAAEQENIVEGYAVVYGVETDLGYFREMIAKGAATEALKNSDEFFLFNHDSNLPLARRKNGTLTATEDEHGVFIRADLSKSKDGPGVYLNVKSGLIDKMSFAFNIEEEEWSRSENMNGTDLRTITKFRELFDYSPVTFPAYKSTELQARNAEAIFQSHSETVVPEESSMEVEEEEEARVLTDVLKLQADLLILGEEK